MARKKAITESVVSICIGLLLLGIFRLGGTDNWRIGIYFVVFCIITGICLWLTITWRRQRFVLPALKDIDAMSGIDFERFLKALLETRGYSVSMTTASGDLGVDLVAAKSGDRIAIQIKRQASNVSRRAVSDAVAGMKHYNCNQAMVVTSSYFTAGAYTLAKSTECRLVDRDELVVWLADAAESKKASGPITGG